MTEEKLPVIFDPNWKKPEKASEALEGALVVIRDEKRWCAGALFETESGDGIVSDLQLPAEVPVCKSVRACSVGALIISVLDGPAVASYTGRIGEGYEGYVENPESALANDPVGAKALIYLDRVLRPDEADKAPRERKATSAKYAVIEFNDQDDAEDDNDEVFDDKYTGHANHLDNVILAFEDAKSLALQEESERASKIDES